MCSRLPRFQPRCEKSSWGIIRKPGECQFRLDLRAREAQYVDTHRYQNETEPAGYDHFRGAGLGEAASHRPCISRSIQVKTAVFRIGISGASVLVCVPMPSLQSACALETRLNAQAGKNGHVQFLGRFEDVCCVTTIKELEGLMLGGMGGHELTRFRKRRQSDRMSTR